MNKEKLATRKKRLMDKAKLSEKDADDKLSKMSDDEKEKTLAAGEEEDKKLAAEEEEKKEKEKKDSELAAANTATVTRLAAGKERLTKLGLAATESLKSARLAAKAGTIALMSAGLYLLNKDDPRYADLPDWDRDSNWHFFVGDQHFRYPKIWEIGAMASGL